MGGCEGNPYPTFQTFITGIDTPFAEGGTALLRWSFLRFFFLAVTLSFAGAYQIILGEALPRPLRGGYDGRVLNGL